MYFTKRILALVLAVIFSFGAVSVTAFAGLLPAVAEGESTLGAAAACTGHTLGTFNGVPACVNSEGELHICENNFLEERFRNYIKIRFDQNSNNYFSPLEVEAVCTISCRGLIVRSLKGIEFFKNLTELNCSMNRLTTLDVSKNVALTDLFCSNNSLTALDVSHNAKLTTLSCDFNKLRTFDVSKNTELTSLYCDRNQLTSLDVSKNVALADLSCDGNKLTVLDVSNNIELTYLSCNYNQLTSFDVSKNTKLSSVSCDIQLIGIIVANRKGFDIRTLISKENLSKVTIDWDIGTYDSETGIIVFNTERPSFKYYFDIGKNGLIMEVTVYFESHEHSYGDYISNGDGTHTRRCTFDGCNASETENCSGGTATCKDKAVCEICGEEYGELDANNHTGEEVWEQTETTHTKKWNCCGKVTVEEAAHTFEHGVCTVCEYTCTHTGGTATCKDKAVCEICGEAYGELNPENHTGGTHIEHEKAATCTEKGYTGDTYCNGCNEKTADGSEIPTKPHTPGEKWVIENGKKVKKCTECGAIAETAPRMPGDVDGDGEITALDYLYLKRYILGTFSGEIVLENADVDGNGKIDAMDYLYLKRGYLGTYDLSQFA